MTDLFSGCPRKITKSYNDSDPNIKTAYFWETAFTNNANKALSNKKNDPVTSLDFLDVHTYKSGEPVHKRGKKGNGGKESGKTGRANPFGFVLVNFRLFHVLDGNALFRTFREISWQRHLPGRAGGPVP